MHFTNHIAAESTRIPILLIGSVLALLLLVMTPELAAADGHLVRIDELLSGANGDSQVQFVELSIAPDTDPLWAPRPGEASPSAGLLFYDATGTQIGNFEFPNDPMLGLPDPEHGLHSILVATQAFVDLTGLAADYIFAGQLPAQDGMVCFAWNDSLVALQHCVAFGNYKGAPEPDGCAPSSLNGFPAPALPIAGESVESLQRYRENGTNDAFGCGHNNADFRLEVPSPRNSAGAIGEIWVTSLPEQGRVLFERETFAGNGRTCATCHREVDGFGLSPVTIAEVFEADPLDPLFVAENVAELAELENSCLMRMGNERGLILVNVRGFHRSPSFRTSPHLLNVGLTAPYGWSASADTLPEFSLSAVLQHFPRTLARNSDPEVGPIDFRLPTSFELDAMESFMNSIRFPRDGNLDLDRMIDLAVRMGADPEAIQRGRDLVSGEVGQAHCSACHSGPTLSDADGRLLTGTGNEVFDIGVAFRVENEDDGCSGGPGDSGTSFPSEFRRFSTPTLLGIANTAPYFHDNSAADLRFAVDHYALDFFPSTEAGNMMEQNGLRTQISEDEIDDIVIFLEAISVDPTGVPLTCGDGFLDSGEACDDGNLVDSDGCSMTCQTEEYRAKIDIDINPRRDPNLIKPFSRLLIPVAMLGSDDFDVTDADVTTLAFGPGEAAPVFDLSKPWIYWLAHWDVNHDGYKDLLSFYQTRGTGIAFGDTEACLVAETLDGTSIEGCDAIKSVLGCGHGFETALLMPPVLWVGARLRRRRASPTKAAA